MGGVVAVAKVESSSFFPFQARNCGLCCGNAPDGCHLAHSLSIYAVMLTGLAHAIYLRKRCPGGCLISGSDPCLHGRLLGFVRRVASRAFETLVRLR